MRSGEVHWMKEALLPRNSPGKMEDKISLQKAKIKGVRWPKTSTKGLRIVELTSISKRMDSPYGHIYKLSMWKLRKTKTFYLFVSMLMTVSS